MTILAQYNSQNVEILDTFTDGAGATVASVKALEGQPFTGGDKFPVHSAFTTCPAAELVNVRQDPQAEQPQRPNLLALALAEARPQWHSGESVWIWKGQHSGAFLKNTGDFIRLFLSDRDPGLVVFYLTGTGWQPVADLESKYQAWVRKVQVTK